MSDEFDNMSDPKLDFTPTYFGEVVTPELPGTLKPYHSKLVHVTGIPNVKNILKQGYLTGGDSCGCSAFSVANTRKDFLAHNSGIALHFTWTGYHRALQATNYISKTPGFEKRADTAYHVFAEKGYWQTNIYEAKGKLIIDCITPSTTPIPPVYPRLIRVIKSIRGLNEKLANFLLQRIDPDHYYYESQKKFCEQLCEQFIGTTLDVRLGNSSNRNRIYR